MPIVTLNKSLKNENEINGINSDNNYLTVNWPTFKTTKKQSDQNYSSTDSKNNGKIKKAGWINLKIFRRVKRTDSYKENLKKLNKQNRQHFFAVDNNSVNNSNVFYVYNQNMPRKLSVITEERASVISSRSNSTDRNQSVIM